MSNLFVQHIPNFVDVDYPLTKEFETTEELLSFDVVNKFTKHKNFSHFVISEKYLMAIYDEGFSYFVVGSILNPELLELPMWKGPTYRAKLANGEKVILTKEVVSSCGNILTLEDGTTALHLTE